MNSNAEQMKLHSQAAEAAIDMLPQAPSGNPLQASMSAAHSMEAEAVNQRARVLYLTFDGLLEPLGRSQVLSYLFGLSARGFAFTLISLERESDLLDASAVTALEKELMKRNIRWIRLLYRAGGMKSVLKNCADAFRAARQVVLEERVVVLHARSYIAALVGWLLRRLYGIPYLFDMRGYWVDELRDEGRWFSNAFAYRVGKLIERRLVKDSSAIVTLTQIQADDLRSGLLKRDSSKSVEVITTCADYDEFAPCGTTGSAIPQHVLEHLEGKLRVGLVGSINASYAMAESLTFFRYLLEERADAHLLCLTRQTDRMKALLREHGIPESAYTLAAVNHKEMSDWLRQMDWALLLLNTRFSKRGSMPTKLAEFFAAGVRPVQYGCNDEVSEKVREAGSGIVLDRLSQEVLRSAARRVATMPLRRQDVERARERSRSHFSLEAGVEKYESLLKRFCSEKSS